MEATPRMLSQPRAAEALAAVMPPSIRPAARFIILLREPTSRLFSWYNHQVRAGWVRSPFATYADNQLHEWRMRSTRTAFAALDPMPDIGRGLYAQSVLHWRRFWMRKALLLLNYHTAFSEMAAVSRAALEQFTGVRPGLFKRENSFRAKSSLPCAARDQLLRFYSPHNEDLYRMVRQDAFDGSSPEAEPPFGTLPPPACSEFVTNSTPTPTPPTQRQQNQQQCRPFCDSHSAAWRTLWGGGKCSWSTCEGCAHCLRETKVRPLGWALVGSRTMSRASARGLVFR